MVQAVAAAEAWVRVQVRVRPGVGELVGVPQAPHPSPRSRSLQCGQGLGGGARDPRQGYTPGQMPCDSVDTEGTEGEGRGAS